MPRILVAIDGSEHANRAFEQAVGLFGKGAEYLMVSVAPTWSPAVALGVQSDLGRPDSNAIGTATHGASTGSMPFAPTADSVRGTIEATYDHFRRAQAQAMSVAGVKAEGVIEEARAGKRRIGRLLVEAADEHGADAIVVGSHGAGVLGGALVGSVTRYVVDNASCPVVVSRDQR